MTQALPAVLFALLLWWSSTGAILWAASRHGHRWLTAVTAPFALLALAGVWQAGPLGPVAGAYLGMSAAIALWGWFELAFLAGVVTGPNRAPCPPGATGWRRFRAAWGAVAHHEVALLGTAVLLLALCHDQPDKTGLWTFLVLFGARISAKLNVYLGVPNLSDEMMPRQVDHLRSYFARRPMNGLFPVSVTALTLATACWVERAHDAPAGSGAGTGFVLLATLTALALVEHWLMVLPVRDAALWTWIAPKRPPADLPAPTD